MGASRPQRRTRGGERSGAGRYLCSFAAGLEQPVAEALASELLRFRALRQWSGLLEFETQARARHLRRLAYVNNVFAVVSSARVTAQTAPSVVVQRLLDDPRVDRGLQATRPAGSRKFRVVYSREGRLTTLGAGLRAELEQRIAQATGLSPDPRGGELEYWVLHRREGEAFLLTRLTRRAATEKDLEKGELRPEIASLLCRMSEPREADRFLDPFAGSGAIALQRARLPHASITCVDSDRERVRRLEQRFSDARVRVLRGDACNLTSIGDGEIDRVVTDPPWGHYAELPEEPARFYARVLRETRRVLAPDGVAVFLCGEREGFAQALESERAGYVASDRCDILLSGRPTSIFRLRAAPNL